MLHSFVPPSFENAKSFRQFITQFVSVGLRQQAVLDAVKRDLSHLLIAEFVLFVRSHVLVGQVGAVQARIVGREGDGDAFVEEYPNWMVVAAHAEYDAIAAQVHGDRNRLWWRLALGHAFVKSSLAKVLLPSKSLEELIRVVLKEYRNAVPDSLGASFDRLLHMIIKIFVGRDRRGKLSRMQSEVHAAVLLFLRKEFYHLHMHVVVAARNKVVFRPDQIEADDWNSLAFLMRPACCRSSFSRLSHKLERHGELRKDVCRAPIPVDLMYEADTGKFDVTFSSPLGLSGPRSD